MEREILHKYAQNVDGYIVHIDNAIKGSEYFCPACKKEFIFKNGQIRQRHFAHKDLSPNCTNESYLHKTFKKYLLQHITEHIHGNSSLVIYFKCNICNHYHNANILNGIVQATEEFSLDGCRPDIVLINYSNQIRIIIEIVVTHEPEQNVIDYCVKNSTILIVIKLYSINDLENIDKIIRNPSFVFLSNKLFCPIFKQASLRNQYVLMSRNIINRGGPRINQIEEKHKKTSNYGSKKYYSKRKNRKR